MSAQTTMSSQNSSTYTPTMIKTEKIYQFLPNPNSLRGNNVDVISIIPSRLFYGVVPIGFYYNLKFAIKNNMMTPLRIRLSIIPGPNELNVLRIINIPNMIAPGCTENITIELMAESNGISFFTLEIVQNYNQIIYRSMIEAHIVSTETFKYIKKSLQLQKRPIFREGVTMMSSIPGFSETFSLVTQSQSQGSFSETAIMDEDDLDDLYSLPTGPNIYWDPFSKCLRIDPLLGRAYTNHLIDLEESIKKTTQERDERREELEEQGFFTPKIIGQIKEGIRFAGISEADISAIHVEEEDDESSCGSLSPINKTNNSKNNTFTGSKTSFSSSMLSSSSKLSSVSSLLALKREKMEIRRRATISAADAFAKSSKEDTMVNSMRTLNMILSRNSSLRSVAK